MPSLYSAAEQATKDRPGAKITTEQTSQIHHNGGGFRAFLLLPDILISRMIEVALEPKRESLEHLLLVVNRRIIYLQCNPLYE